MRLRVPHPRDPSADSFPPGHPAPVVGLVATSASLSCSAAVESTPHHGEVG